MNESATKKRRGVALIHFVLSIYSGLKAGGGGFSGNEVMHAYFKAWQNLWQATFMILQPHFWAVNKIVFFRNMLAGVPQWLMLVLCLSSVVVWSFCFGWLYTKLVDRLNHFPILGIKVF